VFCGPLLVESQAQQDPVRQAVSQPFALTGASFEGKYDVAFQAADLNRVVEALWEAVGVEKVVAPRREKKTVNFVEAHMSANNGRKHTFKIFSSGAFQVLGVADTPAASALETATHIAFVAAEAISHQFAIPVHFSKGIKLTAATWQHTAIANAGLGMDLGVLAEVVTSSQGTCECMAPLAGATCSTNARNGAFCVKAWGGMGTISFFRSGKIQMMGARGNADCVARAVRAAILAGNVITHEAPKPRKRCRKDDQTTRRVAGRHTDFADHKTTVVDITELIDTAIDANEDTINIFGLQPLPASTYKGYDAQIDCAEAFTVSTACDDMDVFGWL